MVKNIVIIGGGFAGVAVASGLEKQLDKSGDKDHRIILIEKVI
jgi:NADH dehydrogenase FAD-containing subunit